MKICTKALLCAAGSLVPILAGCGGSSSSGTNAPVLTPRSVSATLSDGLTATLTEDRSTVPVGGTVTYTVTLTNRTTQPVTYQPVIGGVSIPNAPAALVVADPQGNEAFPVGAIPNYVSIGPSVTLAPGQSVSGAQVVGNSSEGSYSTAGQYTATAAVSIIPGASGGTQIGASVGPLSVLVL